MDGSFHGAMSWLQPMADMNIGDFVFFKLVNNYFTNEIDKFGFEVMGRAMKWVSAIALTATTLWVLLLGYRIATGQSRESALTTMTKAAKIVIIVTFASAVGANGSSIQTATQNLDKEIHELFTGEEESSAEAIDKNLAYTQIALTALDAVNVVHDDPEALEKKGRAIFMAGFGTAGPPMVAGAMLLLFKFTMAFLIGVGPIFILFLMFDQTKDLFKRWLFYVIGTLFSMSMLSVVTGMVLKFTAKAAAAYWAAKIITLNNAEGLSSQALQQGGIGLIMTLVIVTVPGMVAAVWQGQMGTFMAYTAFNNGAASSPGPQGQPAGSYVPQQIARNSNQIDDRASAAAPQHSTRSIGSTGNSQPTQIAGSRGNAIKNEGGSA
ncbi:type IV secretion system protein [Xanthomonas translucens pv. translucens]|uniref:Type IV secretion system protein virB6 n=2 Tax=Xanthomonas campestris pv. translucens TaxID=343 RepID=A0A109HM77_XANCT|nr:type IV secretion system protein [Xanthomonas translucens]KWV14813.1 Type IV secretion system protein virB6 [Xanthomonas translucens]MCT8285848.1 type IV secretion system protein [Xanthomonas translucens pv. translucens]MCT8303506.1 type IV secretion system protein [Xanthomonas translucens pv. translucens]QSQ31187.1 type IV secretion system protein [Xanthomonas translucens pv. translucens]QSQ33001.1 type IV secretion system protein [Xanthomonas translucens pv. translucens]